MSPDWIEIYKTYTGDELAAEITSLKNAISAASGITAQGVGSKNYARDLNHLTSRLAAAVRVQNLRTSSAIGPRLSGHWGVPDFSSTRV